MLSYFRNWLMPICLYKKVQKNHQHIFPALGRIPLILVRVTKIMHSLMLKNKNRNCGSAHHVQKGMVGCLSWLIISKKSNFVFHWECSLCIWVIYWKRLFPRGKLLAQRTCQERQHIYLHPQNDKSLRALQCFNMKSWRKLSYWSIARLERKHF